MPSYIVKCAPDRDEYVYWSDVVEDVRAVGTRAEVGPAPHLLEGAVWLPVARPRADQQPGLDRPADVQALPGGTPGGMTPHRRRSGATCPLLQNEQARSGPHSL